MNKCEKCGAFITEAMVLCDSCATQKDEGELKKRIKDNSILDSILIDEDVIFHKNLFPILDEAKKDFPSESTFYKRHPNVCEPFSIWKKENEDMKKWFLTWFGDSS